MISHGDELGRTQRGNNNGYCQDNEISWIDWAHADADLHRVHPVGLGAAGRAPGVPAAAVLRRPAGAPARRRRACPTSPGSRPDGSEMTEEDWESGFGKSVAVFLNGQGIPDLDVRGQRVTDDSFVLCFNAHHEPIDFTLPPADFGVAWLPVIYTDAKAQPTETPSPASASVTVEARAVMVLQAAPAQG